MPPDLDVLVAKSLERDPATLYQSASQAADELSVLADRMTAPSARLPSDILEQVMTEQQLREKLRKIAALFEGASTAGERQAAAAAIERLRQALDAAAKTQPLPETKFSMADQWQRRLFLALCRRYGLKPYRRRGQRYTTVMLRAPQSFVDETLWPEFVELQAALHSYLNEATERIIRQEVFRDADEAEER
jgi:hypothetical protein